MKSFSIATILAACVFSVVGCKQESAPSSVATDDHGHQHAAGEAHTEHSVAGHSHGAGPHDGVIADWGGGKYHVEFTVDHDQQQATVYILGPDEKSPVPIDAESIDLSITDPAMQLTLTASPQDGNPDGKASRFVGNHEKLGVVQEYAGTISGVVDGTPYSGDFKEEPHGGHAH